MPFEQKLLGCHLYTCLLREADQSWVCFIIIVVVVIVKERRLWRGSRGRERETLKQAPHPTWNPTWGLISPLSHDSGITTQAPSPVFKNRVVWTWSLLA